MYKYQFHIAFNDKANTAASKAVQDCKSILFEMGYRDCSIEDLTPNDFFYLPKLLFKLLKFLLTIQQGALVAIQYPLLSGNRLFKYFIRAARFKKVCFFCIVHDIDDLRYTAHSKGKSNDVEALNHYDYVIAHNAAMKDWLQQNGLTSQVVLLSAFDYLAVIDRSANTTAPAADARQIVFAGNLSKSSFIYQLNAVNNWHFNLYGPYYSPERATKISNICWNGSFSPDEILTSMNGAFGLVWDGDHIDRLDAAYGSYLRYNYPHKLSLYLAAGLPVIAPRQSAISSFIKGHGVGILVDNLLELQQMTVDNAAYEQMKHNAKKLSNDLTTGRYLFAAVTEIEIGMILRSCHLQTTGT